MTLSVFQVSYQIVGQDALDVFPFIFLFAFRNIKKEGLTKLKTLLRAWSLQDRNVPSLGSGPLFPLVL